MDITLYSTHCPKCTILQKKLDSKNIQYDIVDDTDTLIKMGFTTVPMLQVNFSIMDFNEAVQWVNNQ